MDLALKALARKERTELEMAEWLRTRGVAEAQIEGVLSHLIETGAVDDARYAERFAADKRELAGWGAERIREALEVRGVASHHIDAAVAAESAEAELERAVQLLEISDNRLDSDAERARALALLTRRGFPAELAYEAIHRRERALTAR